AIGSVKTNIGHLEGAAGVAGLIKAVLALEHGVVPPNVHFKTLNPFPLDRTPFEIPTEPVPWPANGDRRHAGVSSFGFGGTNAHVLLSESPPPPPATEAESNPPHVLAVSARSHDSLLELAGRYRELLSSDDPPPARDVCH